MTKTDEYDYVVVGGGTAGCVIAARLSQDPSARVLLVEAGSARPERAMRLPHSWPELLGTPADWQDTTTAQADAGPLRYPRGHTLGGSGAINAMAHIRGHQAVYDRWPAGWQYADLLPFFRRSERADGRDLALRGTSGPIRVTPVPPAGRHPVARAFADALITVGCPVSDDLSGAVQEGICWPDLAIVAGRRVSPAGAYLRPVLSRPNLAVAAGCLATRLLIERGRCTGVSYLRQGTPRQAHASREVIVCAGAIGTPHLLMLSGIGPARNLRALGIAPAADLPAVGQNLQDHPVVMTSYASQAPLPRSRYNHGEVYAALRSTHTAAWPDLQLFPVLLPMTPPGGRPPETGFALMASSVAPDSQGSVRLATADPQVPPLIDPGFLTAGTDLDQLEAGLELIRRAAGSGALARLGSEIHPGPDVRTGTGLRGYIRRTVASYYHPAGTCRLGTGSDSAVDLELRVRGVEGLRVADASVMPVIPNAPLNATVLAIAEKAAQLIEGSEHS